MEHISGSVSSATEILGFLRREGVQALLAGARSVLVQLYVGVPDAWWIHDAIETIRSVIPQAVIVGAVSGGEISEGHVLASSTVISVAAFSCSGLFPFALRCMPGDEYNTGIEIAESLLKVPDLKGVLLLGTPAKLACGRILEGIGDRDPEVFVFGGAAAQSQEGQEASVFTGTEAFESGVVGVGFAGASLHIDCQSSMGWKPLGPKLTVTDAEGRVVRKIDGRPAAEVYQRYLGVGTNSELFLLEFPLLIERGGDVLARNPMSFGAEGQVTFVADVRRGETARFGYADIDKMMREIHGAAERLQRFGAEGVFLYSCVCRRFLLQNDVQVETHPLQQVAPVAGFFGHGEFGRQGDRLELLNSTLLAVGMREGGLRRPEQKNREIQPYTVDQHRIRNVRITSRLLDVITALSAELEEKNRLLRFQAEHDALTGAFNRQGLTNRLADELRLAACHHHALSIVMVDIDHFKVFNDNHGHGAGDQVLKSVAARIGGMIRKNDIICRYGGEEFVLILPETGFQEALVVAEKCRAAIESLELQYEGTVLPRVTASFGVSSRHENEKAAGIGPLLRAADVALYRAKAAGRNRIMPIEASTVGRQINVCPQPV